MDVLYSLERRDFSVIGRRKKGTSPRLMEVEGGQWSVNFCGPGNNIVILSRVQGFHPAALLPPKR